VRFELGVGCCGVPDSVVPRCSYLDVAAHANLYMIWAAIGAVALLLLLFSGQFVRELRAYGLLLWTDAAAAKDVFFYSFSGSVVYGARARGHARVFVFVCLFLCLDVFDFCVLRTRHGSRRLMTLLRL
jgi:hypothetical protein